MRFPGLGSFECCWALPLSLPRRVRTSALPSRKLALPSLFFKGLGSRVSGFGFRVWGLGFRELGLGGPLGI